MNYYAGAAQRHDLGCSRGQSQARPMLSSVRTVMGELDTWNIQSCNCCGWSLWTLHWLLKRILGLSWARVWNSARTEIFCLPGRASCLHGASLHPKICLRYFIPPLLSSYLRYNKASRSFASPTFISTFSSEHKELCAVTCFIFFFSPKSSHTGPSWRTLEK